MDGKKIPGLIFLILFNRSYIFMLETIFCTDISKDGMMEGPSDELYKEILKEFPTLHLIASGGVSCYR